MSLDAPHLRRPLTSAAADRQYPRQEPYAVVPHVRICAGGGERSPSLPLHCIVRHLIGLGSMHLKYFLASGFCSKYNSDHR